MNRILMGVLAASAVFTAGVASAQQSASSFWNDSWAVSQAKRGVNLEFASRQEAGRAGGFGPGRTIVTTNIGTQNVQNTQYGDSFSADSTNINNSNSTETTANGSNIVVTTGTNQTAGTTTQGATATTTSSSGNGQVSVISTTPHN